MGWVLVTVGAMTAGYGIGGSLWGDVPAAGTLMGIALGLLFALVGVRFGITPYLAWNDLGIQVRNPFRSYEIEWPMIERVELRPSTPTKVLRRGLAIERKRGSTIVVWVVRKDSVWPWSSENPRAEGIADHLQKLAAIA